MQLASTQVIRCSYGEAIPGVVKLALSDPPGGLWGIPGGLWQIVGPKGTVGDWEFIEPRG